MRLKDGESVQEHIKVMTELFSELPIVGDKIQDEDRVVYLLASLPDSFDTLVTALEVNEEVPKMEVVIERILHSDKKQKEKNVDNFEDRAMASKQQFRRKSTQCFQCGKYGHIKKYCRSESDKVNHKDCDHRVNMIRRKQVDQNDSDSELTGLVVQHAMLVHSGKNAWVIDSGATCHMTNDESFFVQYKSLKTHKKVILGDGYEVDAVGCGDVLLYCDLPSGESKKCKLLEVLHVPQLSYSLLSVSVATQRGRIVSFEDTFCKIWHKDKLEAVATKNGNLYLLNYSMKKVYLNAAEVESHKPKEYTWHRRFGHLGVGSLQKLADQKLVKGFNYDSSKEIGFCQACIEGKLHKTKFPDKGGSRAVEPLELVHSDVCGKFETSSLGGGHYFLTLIDDNTRHVWMYILLSKDKVFEKFVEWKSLVENQSGRKLKTLRTDNGGEYTSNEFVSYLKKEGIRHEYTVPKTPQQNGVAERMNRTLVEAVLSMLLDAKLPKCFWAEALATAVYLRNRSPTNAV